MVSYMPYYTAPYARKELSRDEIRRNWRAAILLGIASSTYSTLISQLGAARLGRDAWVDWMSVAAIPARDWAIQLEPGWASIATGIAFHQWADFSWALVFFGVLGPWTAGLSPGRLALLAAPWAFFTSAVEWLLLVPVFPFAQPIFTLQQPYWLGLFVHLSSAAIYPGFAWIRWDKAERRRRFGGDLALWAWASAIALALIGAAVLTVLAANGRELPWRGEDPAADQRFMRHMRTHHEQGVAIAKLGATRTQDPHLRALARLMGASQSGELKILDSWWASWFAEPLPICSADERVSMPGLLSDDQMQELQSAPANAFNAKFIRMMSFHHAGAVTMADQRLKASGDVRLAMMAHAIRHAQQGEIGLMHGTSGFAAVRDAFANMFGDNLSPEVRIPPKDG
jgi:uncharacterized protein (DUF305 family)